MGAVATIRISDRMTAGLEAMAGRLRDPAKAMASLSQLLRNDVLRNFREGGWFPAKWKPSRRAAATGGKTLIQRATLRNSFHAESGVDYAAVGTDLFYAGVHQGGKVIRPKTKKALRFPVAGGWRTVRQVSIPARPMLPIDEQGNLAASTQTKAARLIQKYTLSGDVA